MEARISRRKAKDTDTEWARETHHIAYREVALSLSGCFDEQTQDSFFFQSWDVGTYEIILSGSAKAGYCSIEFFPSHVYVQELVILPRFQGRGIGKNILQEVIEEARKNNVPVRLQVLKVNPAQHLYRKLGFKEVGLTDLHIQMEWNLGG